MRADRHFLVLSLLAAAACHRETPPNQTSTPRVHLAPGASPKSPLAAKTLTPADVPVADGTPEIARVACPAESDRLDEAAKALDARQYDVALSCAEDELLEDPESALAEQDRGAALLALGRLDDARLAYTHALALDPDDPQTLADAAELYLTHGNVTRELDEIALEYARRGEKRARRHRSDLVEQLDLLQGMAFNDLGRSQEAVSKLADALEHDPKDLDARYEHAVALFELCRFAEARAELKLVLESLPEDAYARHELGLTLEQLGDSRAARVELERATALDGQAFPAPLNVEMRDFRQMVAAAVQALPAPMQKDLSQVKLSVQEMPDLADLTVDDPPLSPTILGLFRGQPLAAAPDPGAPEAESSQDSEPRAILLYRRNLLRVAHTREELAKQVQVTLWHELGHLRGADDDQLRLRGLE